MLQIKHISKQYKTGELVQNALNDVSLNLRDNEFVSILGPSGSGKSTLLRCATLLEKIDSGSLEYLGEQAAWTKDGKAVNCTKLMALMGMGIKCGNTITVTINGGDEAASEKAMQEFFEANL